MFSCPLNWEKMEKEKMEKEKKKKKIKKKGKKKGFSSLNKSRRQQIM